MIQRLVLFITLAALVVGCQGPAPAPVRDAEPSPAASATALPVTDTPLPPSAVPTLQVEPTAEATAAPTAAPVIYGPTGFPANISPLTGKEVADPQLLERRPVAVKIQMFPRNGRPPYGVSLADIVYDYYQNFGMTRFHAVFYGQNAQIVGPIRSARLLDIDLINMYKSIFAYGSAESRTTERLFSQEFAPRLVLEGTANCPPLCRIDPNAFNYLVTNTQDLTTYITDKGVDNARQNLDGMRFDPLLPPGANAGEQIFIRHSISAYARWDYDRATGRYLRFQDVQEAPDLASEAFEPLIDKLTSQQIAADNVVIIVVGHRYAFNSKSGPNEVVEIGMEGVGPAYAFRDGGVFQLTWNRPTKDSVIYLTFPDGTVYPFKNGTTWFEVVGKSSKIGPEGANWRFQHAMP